MPGGLSKIAQKLGMSEAEAAAALKVQSGAAGQAKKVAKVLGISEKDASDLLMCKAAGDDAGMRAIAKRLNMLEALKGAGLL